MKFFVGITNSPNRKSFNSAQTKKWSLSITMPSGMMMSVSRLENKMAKLLQQSPRSIQIVGPHQLLKGDKINLGACRGGCTRYVFLDTSDQLPVYFRLTSGQLKLII